MLENYQVNVKRFRGNMIIILTAMLVLFVWGIIITMQLDMLPLQLYKFIAPVGSAIFLVVMIVVRKLLKRSDRRNLVVTIIIDYLIIFLYGLLFGSLFWAHDNVENERIDYSAINGFIMLYMSSVTFAGIGYLIGMQPLAKQIRNATSKSEKIALMLINSYLGIIFAIIPVSIAFTYGLTITTILFAVIIWLTVIATILMLNQLSLKQLNTGVELEPEQINSRATDIVLIALLSPIYIFYYLINYRKLHK